MKLAYGKTEVTLELPRGTQWRELRIKEMPPLTDPVQAIRQALRKPIATPPLAQIVRPGETVCLLVNDPTRVARSELFLPLVLDELELAGVKPADIFIVFTTGTHRAVTREEMITLVGAETAGRVALFNHDCHNENELVRTGTTSRGTPVWINARVAAADRRILTGSVVYHFFAGFGGGRKALVPGVAGWETIRTNHSLMLEPNAVAGRLEGNPVHEDLLEGARMVGADFLLNLVLNEKKEVLGVFAGGMEEAHRPCCTLVKEVYGVELETPADVVIASCGGHPKDINVYQAQKTLENAVRALREGGQVILLACCPEGTGSAVYEEWALRHRGLEELRAALSENFVIGGHKAFAVARALSRTARVFLVSSLSADLACSLGFTPAASLKEAVAEIYRGRRGEELTCVLPQCSLTVPLLIEDRVAGST